MRIKNIILLLFYFTTTNIFAQSIIKHVEPTSWWIGMKDPKVQLLIHGKNVKNSTVTTNYKGVKVSQTASLESPNYVFVDLVISPSTTPGEVPLKITTSEGKVEVINYPISARREGSANRPSYDNSDVIYLITPDRFVNGDPSNDATVNTLEKPNRTDKDGRHGGDIQGMINHIDYIADMGYTVIWPMPLQENNQPKVTYHGYAISDFYEIDPRYGTNELYRELSEKAAQKGVKLIQDIILNHCGINHWWMKDLPSEDWINFKGKFSPTNHRRQIHQDPHASAFDSKQHTDGWFVPSMPDLNQRNPFMANYLIQNTLWWIEYANLSGLRVDTYPYSDKSFLTDWSKRITTEYPNINIVGEEWSTNAAVTSYWQRGKDTHDGYVSYLPSVMDFPLQNALIEALNGDEKVYNQGLVKIYESLANDFLYPNPDNLVVFTDNHDMSRFFTQVNEDLDLFKMGMIYLLTTRGIPQVYYGTEVLLNNPNSDAHGEIRADFPGGWEGDSKNAFTGKNLTDKEKDAQEFIKKLLNWRKSAKAIHQGKLIHFAPVNGVYVFFRILNEEAYMVVLNKNESSESIQLIDYEEVTATKNTAIDVLSGQSITSKQPLTIKAKSAVIFELK